jgi:hypothetical protein
MYPCFFGKEVEMPEGSVGVDDYSRFRIVDGEVTQIEFYPWPRRHPILAIKCALGVLRWHVDMIRRFGFTAWNEERKH